VTERPARVTVTHPRTRAAERSERSVLDAEAPGPVNELAVATIVRGQLALAVRFFLTLVVVLVTVPLVVTRVAWVRSIEIAGVPIAWVALGGGFFPVFLVLGHRYVRAAERLEDRFVDVVERW
jgi:hypothetical protein